MRKSFLLSLSTLGVLLLIDVAPIQAEIQRWRVGDADHPWNLSPVTGRLTWGQGWAVEIITDDDGDGLIDEDPVELFDDDGDGLINEDPLDPQVDNDEDGQLNEDPIDRVDNDGDGLVDEDPEEAFDNDGDGLVNEDGPDPQIDNDGDGLLNEDGLMTNGDDDYDGQSNEDPPDGEDNDGDGLIDEDGPRLEHDPNLNITTWLRPIRLDSLRNLATLLNERYLEGEFGGVLGLSAPLNPYNDIPSEYGFRREKADPISARAGGISIGGGGRINYEYMVDGDLFTSNGAADWAGRLPNFNLKGYFYINRIILRPRPSLPEATPDDYWIRYGDPTTIDIRNEALWIRKTMVPRTAGNKGTAVKDNRFDPPILAGKIEPYAYDRREIWIETAEAGLYGEGYPLDASFTSEIIDVGSSPPRYRRYSREMEQFSLSERSIVEDEFLDLPGKQVNWGRARWRGRRIGTEGDVRIQFRVGNSLDTHIYQRILGAGLVDDRDEFGDVLTPFVWLKLLPSEQVQMRFLPYNELELDLGPDGKKGWGFWSAPFKFEDGLIDESLPPEEWDQFGVPLPLPGATRYIQFRILFDSTIDSAVQLDFLEFEYDIPLVTGGVLTEIFPPRVPLGEEVSFHYYIRPLFDETERTSFNRLEIEVPDINTRIDTLRFDGQDWQEIAVPADVEGDPLLPVIPRRLDPAAGSIDSLGQFAQMTVLDPTTGSARLELKLPPMQAEHFRLGENIEVVFSSTLYRGSKQFTSVVWDDQQSDRSTSIPQPTKEGNATPEVATDAVLVVVDDIGEVIQTPQIHPNPFTPNGDGINDEVVIAFDLFLFLDQVEIEVGIFDLSGRRVHRLEPQAQSAGKMEVRWDGRNSDGNLIPPGIYLYHLKVNSDVSSNQYTGTLSLAY